MVERHIFRQIGNNADDVPQPFRKAFSFLGHNLNLRPFRQFNGFVQNNHAVPEMPPVRHRLGLLSLF